jgi:hypothetical protein
LQNGKVANEGGERREEEGGRREEGRGGERWRRRRQQHVVVQQPHVEVDLQHAQILQQPGGRKAAIREKPTADALNFKGVITARSGRTAAHGG